MNATQLLQRLQQIADVLLDERSRLVRERAAFLLAAPVIWDPLQLRAQADAILGLIEALETFVGQVLPRIEAAVRKGDLSRGAAGVNAGERIINAVGGYSAVTDFRDNVRQTAVAIIDETKATVGLGLGLGAFGAGAVVVGLLVWKFLK